ncbi:hypothetical protein [Herminiimonas contaminans]|uniref:Uncharacterized protein n=1 Tax=Herminiimonas contaminans TaxID=1111140 RepID=A0ABS0EWG1_9BURK|nr:hypothetical protein [Herminiimonas contaminans]MBF8179090.1 hypothetical protein [Herminiimonas contaminans]
MGIGQKVRSLHCGFQQGLGFEVIAEENVILLKNVPFELEDIVTKWIAVLPTELMSGPDPLVKLYPTEGLALTESGWSAFVSWMTETLNSAQHEPNFPLKARQSAKNSVE